MFKTKILTYGVDVLKSCREILSLDLYLLPRQTELVTCQSFSWTGISRLRSALLACDVTATPLDLSAVDIRECQEPGLWSHDSKSEDWHWDYYKRYWKSFACFFLTWQCAPRSIAWFFGPVHTSLPPHLYLPHPSHSHVKSTPHPLLVSWITSQWVHKSAPKWHLHPAIFTGLMTNRQSHVTTPICSNNPILCTVQAKNVWQRMSVCICAYVSCLRLC